jgi:Gpi18-like mannosyltransferase
MKFSKKRALLVLGVILILLSLFIRYKVSGLHNPDMNLFINWYDHLHRNGWSGLADEDFSNYPPAYLYLLWFSTLFSGWLEPAFSIKLIPTFFDLISAATIFLMARMRYGSGTSFTLAAAFFTLPTVMMNSTGWGQIDSLYTSFLLICVYLLLREKPFWAMLAYGIAFSFKAQSIFLLPFLGLIFLSGKLRWFHFLLVPAVYLVLALPAILIGRSWESILFLYTGQVDQFKNLAKTAPNLYIFISDQYYQPVVMIGITIFLIIMAFWAWNYWRAKIALTHPFIIFTALTSLALSPFLLPKMHDRYFYPADVFSFASALFIPTMWFVPVLYQVISGLAYTIFLFEMPVELVKTAAVINIFAVVYLFRRQLMFLYEERKL